MTNEELKKKLIDSKSDLYKMKLQHAVSHIESPSQIKYARRNIARILTELKKRDI